MAPSCCDAGADIKLNDTCRSIMALSTDACMETSTQVPDRHPRADVVRSCSQDSPVPLLLRQRISNSSGIGSPAHDSALHQHIARLNGNTLFRYGMAMTTTAQLRRCWGAARQCAAARQQTLSGTPGTRRSSARQLRCSMQTAGDRTWDTTISRVAFLKAGV